MRFDERVPDLAPMRAGVHDQRPADRTGHAAQEREALDARLCRGLGDILVGRGGAGDDATIVRNLDRAEGPAAEPYDEARNSAVTYDEVRAEADRRDRDLARQRRQNVGEIVLVGRGKQGLGRTADPEPGRIGAIGASAVSVRAAWAPAPYSSTRPGIGEASRFVERGEFAGQRIGPLRDRRRRRGR